MNPTKRLSSVKPTARRWSPKASVLIAFLCSLSVIVFILMDSLVESVHAIHNWMSQPEASVLPEELSADQCKMYSLSHLSNVESRDIVDSIVADRDERFIPVFIEMMRSLEQNGMQGGITKYFFALDELGGQRIRGGVANGELTSSLWIEWYGRTDIVPPDGFVGWKGQLLGRIDPIYPELLYDGVNTTIRVEEILSGGVSFDSIRSLDQPQTVAADAALSMDPDEPVFGIELAGQVRAYPQRILDRHELVNDVVGDIPVSLVYCTLCGAAIAYDGRTDNGETYTFGSSGLLYRSNKLMFDRETRMLWNHLTGRPVVGELAGTELKLRKLPVVTASWKDWLADHPETEVLDFDTGFPFRYKLGTPYGGYFSSAEQMFPVSIKDDRLPLKSRVYGLTIDETSKAWPLKELTAAQVVNDQLCSTSLVFVATRRSVEVRTSVETRLEGTKYFEYNAGGEVRAYDTDGKIFQTGSETGKIRDADGDEWDVTESALVGPDGQRAPRVNGFLSYWLGWYGAHPDTLLYGEL